MHYTSIVQTTDTFQLLSYCILYVIAGYVNYIIVHWAHCSHCLFTIISNWSNALCNKDRSSVPPFTTLTQSGWRLGSQCSPLCNHDNILGGILNRLHNYNNISDDSPIYDKVNLIFAFQFKSLKLIIPKIVIRYRPKVFTISVYIRPCKPLFKLLYNPRYTSTC